MYRRWLGLMACAVALLGGVGATVGQEGAGNKISVAFLPPPLETATYSLGIYDAKSHKLVRHLREMAPTSAFTTGLNGLITSWDGRDDAGKAVPAGKYNVRGYAVGALKVEGEGILGNDWAADDENLRLKRVDAIAALPGDGGLAVLGEAASGHAQVACFNGKDGALRWQKEVPADPARGGKSVDPIRFLMVFGGDTLIVRHAHVFHLCRLDDGSEVHAEIRLGPPPSPLESPGKNGSPSKDGTTWRIEEGVLSQYEHGRYDESGQTRYDESARLRSLAPKEGEPVPVAVVVPTESTDRLYLLEETKGWQRVRGLSWQETKQEGDKVVSTWATFFENSIRSDLEPGGKDAKAAPVELALVENPLSPGKGGRVKLSAAFDEKGSYLATADGLRLRQISQRANLRAAKLVKPAGVNRLTFYQYDGAAWDEFSVEGAREMMEFDAGDIDMTATGEKPSAKASEPDL